MSRRMPHLSLLEVLIGGLLAAGTIALLLGALRSSRAEDAQRHRLQVAQRVLDVTQTKLAPLTVAELTPLPVPQRVAGTEVRFQDLSPSPAPAGACKAFRIIVTHPHAPKESHTRALERCP